MSKWGSSSERASRPAGWASGDVIAPGRDRPVLLGAVATLLRLDLDRGGRAADLDAVLDQQVGEPRGAGGGRAGQEQVVADRPVAARGRRPRRDSRGSRRPARGHGRGRLDGREAADVMMPDAVVVVELRPVVAVDDQAAGARLFPEDADRAVEDGPGRAVAGIEAVVVLAGRVGEAELVEPRPWFRPNRANQSRCLGVISSRIGSIGGSK